LEPVYVDDKSGLETSLFLYERYVIIEQLLAGNRDGGCVIMPDLVLVNTPTQWLRYIEMRDLGSPFLDQPLHAISPVQSYNTLAKTGYALSLVLRPMGYDYVILRVPFLVGPAN
jgi:hypothetical protein